MFFLRTAPPELLNSPAVACWLIGGIYYRLLKIASRGKSVDLCPLPPSRGTNFAIEIDRRAAGMLLEG